MCKWSLCGLFPVLAWYARCKPRLPLQGHVVFSRASLNPGHENGRPKGPGRNRLQWSWEKVSFRASYQGSMACGIHLTTQINNFTVLSEGTVCNIKTMDQLNFWFNDAWGCGCVKDWHTGMLRFQGCRPQDVFKLSR